MGRNPPSVRARREPTRCFGGITPLKHSSEYSGQCVHSDQDSYLGSAPSQAGRQQPSVLVNGPLAAPALARRRTARCFLPTIGVKLSQSAACLMPVTPPSSTIAGCVAPRTHLCRSKGAFPAS